MIKNDENSNKLDLDYLENLIESYKKVYELTQNSINISHKAIEIYKNVIKLSTNKPENLIEYKIKIENSERKIYYENENLKKYQVILEELQNEIL